MLGLRIRYMGRLLGEAAFLLGSAARTRSATETMKACLPASEVLTSHAAKE